MLILTESIYSLSLSRHTNVSDLILAELVQHTCLLTHLNIGNSMGVGDQTLCSLSQCMCNELLFSPSVLFLDTPRLSVLMVDNNSNITDMGVGKVLQTCPITILSLTFCCRITGMPPFSNNDFE